MRKPIEPSCQSGPPGNRLGALTGHSHVFKVILTQIHVLKISKSLQSLEVFRDWKATRAQLPAWAAG